MPRAKNHIKNTGRLLCLSKDIVGADSLCPDRTAVPRRLA